MDAQALYVLLQLRADDVRIAGDGRSGHSDLGLAAIPGVLDATAIAQASVGGGDDGGTGYQLRSLPPAPAANSRTAPSLVAALATAVVEGRVVVPDGADRAPAYLPGEITDHESAAYKAWTAWIETVSGMSLAFGL
jgi:hypothetical protein